MPNLDGVTLKMNRAHDYLDLFNADLKLFLQSNPYELLPKSQSESSKKTFVMKIRAVPPLQILGHADGFFQDLRSALEYLIWELTQINPTCQPSNKVGFPIFLNPKRYKKEGIPKIKCIPEEAKLIIEELQPYNGLKTVDPLWVILHMADTDKHRYPGLVSTGIRISAPLENNLAVLVTGDFNDVDEIPKEVSDFIDANTEIDFKVDPVFSIVVEKGPVKVHVSVDGINPIYNHVRNNVIARFEKFFS